MTSPSFLPTAAIETLKKRALLLNSLREVFHQQQYWEVETPLLSQDSCVDAYIDTFAVPISKNLTGHLQTSPEFAMKRLLCAGADRIYQVTRSFRKDEQGARHNPEFTIVEWYALHCDSAEQMNFVENLVHELEHFAIQHGWLKDENKSSLPFERITYKTAFQRWLNLCPLTSSDEQLIEAACQRGMQMISQIPDRDDVLNWLLAECIEPEFFKMQGVFLYNYPASQAALAKVHEETPLIAERFELYLNGIEICNGYTELTDAEELRRRMTEQNQKRTAQGLSSLPVESKLIQAMEVGLPECSGVALGWDRLVMHCLNLPTIQDVIPFPFDRA